MVITGGKAESEYKGLVHFDAVVLVGQMAS